MDFSSKTKKELKEAAELLEIEVTGKKKKNKPTHDEYIAAFEEIEGENAELYAKLVEVLTDEEDEDTEAALPEEGDATKNETEEADTEDEADQADAEEDVEDDSDADDGEGKTTKTSRTKRTNKNPLQAALIAPKEFKLDAAGMAEYLRNQLQNAINSQVDVRDLDLSGADLTGLVATGVDFTGCNFEDAILKDAILQGCKFEQANFEGADLEGADIRWSVGIKRLNHMGVEV